MRREQIFEYWQGRPLKFRVVISFLVIAFGIIAFLIGIILDYVKPGENFFLALTNTLLAAGITLLVYAFISFLEKPEKRLGNSGYLLHSSPKAGFQNSVLQNGL